MYCWVCCTVAVNKVASVVLSRLQGSEKTFFHRCGLLYSDHLAFSTCHRAATTRSAKILDRPKELFIWNISWIFEVKTILPYRNQSKTTMRFNNWSGTNEMSFNNVLWYDSSQHNRLHDLFYQVLFIEWWGENHFVSLSLSEIKRAGCLQFRCNYILNIVFFSVFS